MNNLKFKHYLLTAVICIFCIGLNSFAEITVLEQAADISKIKYIKEWPSLAVCFGEDETINKECVMAMNNKEEQHIRSGILNLKAQIQRQQGDYQQALSLIDQGLALEPEQHLHYFQQAIINYNLLRNSKGGMTKWKYSKATAKSYGKALSLYPNEFYYRYYVTYDYLVKPAMVGGDKDKALVIAKESIELGLKEFYPVRADVYRYLDKPELALADYDLAIENNIYKTSSFAEAVKLAEQRGDSNRVEKYQAFIDMVQKTR